MKVKINDRIQVTSGAHKGRKGVILEEYAPRIWTVAWDNGGFYTIHENNFKILKKD